MYFGNVERISYPWRAANCATMRLPSETCISPAIGSTGWAELRFAAQIRAHGFPFRNSTPDDVVHETRHCHFGTGFFCAACRCVGFRIPGLPDAFARAEPLGH